MLAAVSRTRHLLEACRTTDRWQRDLNGWMIGWLDGQAAKEDSRIKSTFGGSIDSEQARVWYYCFGAKMTLATYRWARQPKLVNES